MFSIPFMTFALLVLLLYSRSSDPGSHCRSFSPLPSRDLALLALHFYREKLSALPSLVDSRRIVPTHAIIGALDS